MKQHINITVTILIMVILIQGCGSKKNTKENIDTPTVRTADTIPPKNDTLNEITEKPEITQRLPGDMEYTLRNNYGYDTFPVWIKVGD